MNNASYHKSELLGTPNPNRMKKQKIFRASDDFGLTDLNSTSSIEARVLLQCQVKYNVPIEIVTAAQNLGHSV